MWMPQAWMVHLPFPTVSPVHPVSIMHLSYVRFAVFNLSFLSSARSFCGQAFLVGSLVVWQSWTGLGLYATVLVFLQQSRHKSENATHDRQRTNTTETDEPHNINQPWVYSVCKVCERGLCHRVLAFG